MKKLGVTLLLSACFASPVSAGCAWVVWATASVSGFVPIPVDSSETRGECEKAIFLLLIKQSDARRLNPSSTDLDLNWRCLPDTIDLRGIKGK